MGNKKQTMYEILQVAPTASLAEIKAAHRRQSVAAMSGALGLSREDCEFRLKLLDTALHTLSVPALRDAYDAELAPPAAPEQGAVVPAKTQALSLVDEAKANEILAAIKASNPSDAKGLAHYRPQIQIVSSTVSASARSLKTILRAVIGLLVLGFVLTMGRIAFASRGGHVPTAEEARAEDHLIILEYYKKYGERPASRAEAEFLETENRRKENEQRQAEFAEKRQQEEYSRFVEDSREMGERVHDNLAREEEREKWRQQQLEEEKRQQEEAAKEEERMRIENEKRRYGIYD